jgi:hypothetical protein
MRNLKKLCAACVLTFILALPAFAGNMGTGDVTPPPPPPDSQSAITGDMEAGVTGNMETGVTGNMGAGVTSSVTDAALSLVQSLLSVF